MTYELEALSPKEPKYRHFPRKASRCRHILFRMDDRHSSRIFNRTKIKRKFRFCQSSNVSLSLSFTTYASICNRVGITSFNDSYRWYCSQIYIHNKWNSISRMPHHPRQHHHTKENPIIHLCRLRLRLRQNRKRKKTKLSRLITNDLRHTAHIVVCNLRQLWKIAECCVYYYIYDTKYLNIYKNSMDASILLFGIQNCSSNHSYAHVNIEKHWKFILFSFFGIPLFMRFSAYANRAAAAAASGSIPTNISWFLSEANRTHSGLGG